MANRTPLYDRHVVLGGRMVEFGGFELPVQYEGIIKEHLAVRNTCGLFDVSHMGEIRIKGPEALEFVERAVSRSVKPLKTGRMRYALLCNERGGIEDDLMVYRFSRDDFLLVVNAGPKEKDLERLVSCADEWSLETEIADLTDETAKIDIQGPLAVQTACSVLGEWPARLRPFACEQRDTLLVSRSGYTGEDGLEIYLPAEDAEEMWESLMEVGRDNGLVPCGLGARDTLRLEACLVLSGVDIGPEYNPFEAGLGWAVSLEKDFSGRDALKKAKQKVTRKLVPFIMDSRRAARHGDEIRISGKAAGEVTSGAYSPVLEKGIGMGYIKVDESAPGTIIETSTRNRILKGTIESKPLVAPVRP